MRRRKSGESPASAGASSVAQDVSSLDPGSLPSEPGGSLDLTGDDGLDLGGDDEEGGDGLDLDGYQAGTEPGAAASGNVSLAPVMQALTSIERLQNEQHKFQQESREYLCKDLARELHQQLEPFGKILARMESKLETLTTQLQGIATGGGGNTAAKSSSTPAAAQPTPAPPKQVPDPIKNTVTSTLQRAAGKYKSQPVEAYATTLLGNSKFQEMLKAGNITLTAGDIHNILVEKKLADKAGNIL